MTKRIYRIKREFGLSTQCLIYRLRLDEGREISYIAQVIGSTERAVSEFLSDPIKYIRERSEKKRCTKDHARESEYIKAHYGQDKRVKDIAKHLGLSPSTVVTRARKLGLLDRDRMASAPRKWAQRRRDAETVAEMV